MVELQVQKQGLDVLSVERDQDGELWVENQKLDVLLVDGDQDQNVVWEFVEKNGKDCLDYWEAPISTTLAREKRRDLDLFREGRS